MAKVYVFMADGCEEIEALTPVDLLIRAGHEVKMVSIMGKPVITGAHGIQITTDLQIEDEDLEDGDLYICPGGLPGSQYLADCKKLTDLLVKKNAEGKRLAAICAAPGFVLGQLHLLEGKKATCYPGVEGKMIGAIPQSAPAVTDGNITTGRGMGAAVDFGLELVKVLADEAAAEAMAEDVVFAYYK